MRTKRNKKTKLAKGERKVFEGAGNTEALQIQKLGRKREQDKLRNLHVTFLTSQMFCFLPSLNLLPPAFPSALGVSSPGGTLQSSWSLGRLEIGLQRATKQRVPTR